MKDEVVVSALVKATVISVMSPVWISVGIGSFLLATILQQNSGKSKMHDAFMVALHVASSLFLFLPMVLAYYSGVLTAEQAGAVTVVVTAIVIRFAPTTFDVAEDIIHSLLPKLAEKYLGVKGDKQ